MTAGIVVVLPLIPIAHHANMACQCGSAVVPFLIAEATICVAMLSGKIYFRALCQQKKQASVLASAIREGVL